jgi:hypothetical protein
VRVWFAITALLMEEMTKEERSGDAVGCEEQTVICVVSALHVLLSFCKVKQGVGTGR